jgi:HTH-type transcriptional regulator, transcriptional repressor of NAD biosynthesis genes
MTHIKDKYLHPFDGRGSVGVTVGKFMPLHSGHELMIEMAADELQELIVIVSDELGMEYLRHPSLDERYDIIRKKYSGHDNIRVVKHRDQYGPALAYDADGTAVDPDFWEYWCNVFKMLAPDATHIVSSDRYGGVMAERLKVKWFPVDPDRELFSVSGTKIRQNPLANWQYISREFRPYFAKKIVVIGPESSGKSTLVRDLGERYGSPAVPEYGRILSEAYPDLDDMDFNSIVRRQEYFVRKACMESQTGLVFVDTEKLVTWLYGKIYLDRDMYLIRDRVTPEEFDLWVLVPPLLPWVDDGTRIQSDLKDRYAFYHELERRTDPDRHLRHSGDFTYNRVILTETDRQRRVDIVSANVAKLLDVEDSLVFDNLNQSC